MSNASGILVDGARKRLWGALHTSLRIYHPAREWMLYNYESFNENPYQPRVAQKVVGLAFLNAVAAWEQFVESIFLGYLAGARSAAGYSPNLLVGPCRNRPHALRLLGAVAGGDPHRLLRWNDWNWVGYVAAVYFRSGAPFTSMEKSIIARLGDAQVIRNRVAHDSAKSRDRFKRCVNALQGAPLDKALPRGFTPGAFLANTASPECFPSFGVFPRDDHTWGDFFESFIAMFFEASIVLVPGP